MLQLSVGIAAFEALFNRVTDGPNIIASFLRSVLYGGGHVNFLLFHTENDDYIKDCFKAFFVHQMYYVAYTLHVLRADLDFLLSHLLRFYGASVSYYQSVDHRFSVASVLAYMENNWKTLTLEALAATFGYSPAYMSAMIRRETGETFTALIKRRRMEEAERLLCQSGLKIAEIASASGFPSPEHFSRSLREFFGKSPEEYRKSI